VSGHVFIFSKDVDFSKCFCFPALYFSRNVPSEVPMWQVRVFAIDNTRIQVYFNIKFNINLETPSPCSLPCSISSNPRSARSRTLLMHCQSVAWKWARMQWPWHDVTSVMDAGTWEIPRVSQFVSNIVGFKDHSFCAEPDNRWPSSILNNIVDRLLCATVRGHHDIAWRKVSLELWCQSSCDWYCDILI